VAEGAARVSEKAACPRNKKVKKVKMLVTAVLVLQEFIENPFLPPHSGTAVSRPANT